ncbi:hypothetical protein BCM02_102678 [Paenibacillus methanolicus]|uniref:Uncharacterized protein n=1 Tax=Paenibacillus methanolicus TaxID=582686 RepID=A0A5S5CFB8_9BACL|nr:hypothetical protein BCM02_102678 [Paenibacillus methanolicus]
MLHNYLRYLQLPTFYEDFQVEPMPGGNLHINDIRETSATLSYSVNGRQCVSIQLRTFDHIYEELSIDSPPFKNRKR